METIGSAIRSMFIRIMRDEIIELQDRAETLKNAEMYDEPLKHHLTFAYEHLWAARLRADELEGSDEPQDSEPMPTVACSIGKHDLCDGKGMSDDRAAEFKCSCACHAEGADDVPA